MRRRAPSIRDQDRNAGEKPEVRHHEPTPVPTQGRVARVVESCGMRVGRHEVAITNPDKVFFPEPRADEGRPRRVLRRRRRLRPAPPAPAAVPHEAVPERRRGGFLPPEARAREASGLRRRGAGVVPERPLDRLRGRRQRGRARVGRQPRLHRAAHVALARARHRAARLPADRPRPDDRRAMGVRPRDRARREGGDGRARARVVPEDLRRDRAAHPRADQAGAAVPGGAPVREGARGGGRAAHRRPGGRDDDLARRRPGRRLRRLRPERARPDDRVRLLDPAGRRRARLGAASAGTRSRPSTRRRSRSKTMRERIDEVGDPMPGCGGAPSRSGRASSSSASELTRRATRRRRRFAAARAGRSSRQVQSSGSLSSRQRISFVPWRKRLPCTLS